MKKRLLSFFLVFIMIFSGAFSCIASAASKTRSGVAEYFFKLYYEALKRPAHAIEDFWHGYNQNMEQFEQWLNNKLHQQKQHENQNFNGGKTRILCQNGDIINLCLPEIPPNSFVYLNSKPKDGFLTDAHNNIVCGNLVVYIVDESDAEYCFSGNDGNTFFLRSTQPVHYQLWQYYFKYLTADDDSDIDGEFNSYSTGNKLEEKTATLNKSFSHGFDNTTEKFIFISSSFHLSPLSFNSSFDINDDTLTIVLTASRPIVPDIDGSLYGQSGLMFDDGNGNLTYAGDYVGGMALGGGRVWSWNYDIDSFTNFVYRRRCGLDGYYAFVAVVDSSGEFLYTDEMELELDPPGGIFQDVEDPPSYDDYKPDPEPRPEFPDISFNFSYNSNYTSISNYSFTDNSSQSSFWNYVSTSSQTINNNINVLNENIINFGNAVSDYVEDGGASSLEYVGDLITAFNNDFNNRFDAMGDFVGDNFDTLNHNISVIGDNIVNAIKTQVVPDKDYLFEIASTRFPFVSDLKVRLDDFNAESRDIVVTFPALTSSGSPEVRAVKRSSVRAGSPSINNAGDGGYTYNLSESLRNYGLPQYREVGSLFILGATVWSLINITFRIFGMGFAKDYSEAAVSAANDDIGTNSGSGLAGW